MTTDAATVSAISDVVMAAMALVTAAVVIFQLNSGNRLNEIQLVMTFMRRIPELGDQAELARKNKDQVGVETAARALLADLDLILGLVAEGVIKGFGRKIIMHDVEGNIVYIVSREPFRAIFLKAEPKSYFYLHQWLKLHEIDVKSLPKK